MTTAVFYTLKMRKGRRKKAAHTDDLLSMALIGYESAKETIEKKILEIRKMIGGSGKAITAAVETYTKAAPRKKRTLTAKARRAISLAQKRRWRDARKTAKATVKTVKAKVKRTVKAAKLKAANVVP